MLKNNNAKFSIGEVVKHRHFDFRGVIYDVNFEFNNSEEWYQSIPKEVRPRKDQPFYHLLAESNDVTYEAYVSEQNLLLDLSKEPVRHPLIEEIFSGKKVPVIIKFQTNCYCLKFNIFYPNLRHRRQIYFLCLSLIENYFPYLTPSFLNWAYNTTFQKNNIIVVKRLCLAY